MSTRNAVVIDLSHHNEVADFGKVYASGVRGVIHKATQGSTFIDADYASRRATAQAAMVNGTTIFAGPDTDTLTGATNRQASLVHFNATGADACATLWKTALDAVF